MQLKPTYKKLAAEFDDVATVKVAAMDATAHDPPKDFEVQGYPTIYFVPKGKPVSYDGGRDLDSMVEYIKGNAVTIKDNCKKQRNPRGMARPETKFLLVPLRSEEQASRAIFEVQVI